MRLALRDVWASPPGVTEPVIRGLSCEVAAGEWVALGGANGCGKTTMLLVAAGLLPLRRGTREVGFDEGLRAPRIATILQDPSVQLFAPTVAEEIGLTALHLGFPQGAIEREVARQAAALGLEEELSLPPRALSAGRQQLVLLAAALASVPDFLVADEAGAHLDVEARSRVLEVLREERARGLAILWATQEPAERIAADRALELTRDPDGMSRWEPWVDRSGTHSRSALADSGGTPALVLRVGPDPGPVGPRVRVSRPLEIAVPPRGIMALTGPNGSGKTVLLMAACGLLDLPQVEVGRRSKEGAPLFVGQYPEQQVFEESVEKEVIFAAVARGVSPSEARSRAAAALERLGVGRLLADRRRTWELSAGERRLVLLAGAVIAPAGLLGLDEPTAGLDPDRRNLLAPLLAERAEVSPILLASQDQPWIDLLGCRRLLLGGENRSSPSKKTD